MTNPMRASYDVAIVGGGPGGAAAAIFAARHGLSAVIVEKDCFPRYHIGESLTGSAGELLRALGLGPAMAERGFPVKSGVKVLGQSGNEYFVPVLASTWQVRRDEFDTLLLARAEHEGARVIAGHARGVVQQNGAVCGLVYAEPDTHTARELRCRALIDASGTGCFLSHAGVAGNKRFDAFGDQIAVFSQLRGAQRDPGEMGDNTFIFHERPHHWAWFIPLGRDIVSVGIVVPKAVFHALGKERDAVFRWGVEHIHPDLRARLQDTTRVEPVRAIKDYSYRITPFAGAGWLCVGDAHRFADPIFSFGVTASMQEAQRAIETVAEALQAGDWQSSVARYTRYSDGGQDAIFDFIRYFWSFPGFFGLQMRGKLRKDVIRLFGGDLFVPNAVVDHIRALMAGAAAPAPCAERAAG